MAFNSARDSRTPERWYGPVAVIGHTHDGASQIYSYMNSFGGTCALVTGLHPRPSDIEECLARPAYLKEVKELLREASQGASSYMDLRGDRMAGELSQQELVLRWMHITG